MKHAGGPVYLVATGDALLPKVARRAYDALGKSRARVAVSYAPVARDPRGLKFMSERMTRLFPDATLEPLDSRADADRADLIFVSGGDPTLGAKVLEQTGASEWLRSASARGAAVMGVSAGAIALGAWWADWGDDDEDDDESAAAALVRCAGVVPGIVFDTHNEEDDWDELRIVSRLCGRAGEKARFVGIPSGGALVFRDGEMEVVGHRPFELR